MRTLLVFLTCLLATGCMGDGSSGSPLTEAEWQKAANAICAEEGAELVGVPEDDLETVLTQTKQIRAAAISRLRDLRPPAETEDRVNEWLELNDAFVEWIDKVAAVPEDADDTTLGELDAEAADIETKLNALESELGLTDC